MSETFIKLKRSSETLELLKYPNAFTLGAQIALRANRRGPDYSAYKLERGEALIGDHKSLGMTRGEYRWAKKILKRIRFASFRTTNRGTIARLINSGIFDINIDGNDHQYNHPTAMRQPSDDHQTTSNKNIKELKECKKNNVFLDSELKKSESGLSPEEALIVKKESVVLKQRILTTGVT